MNPFDMQLLPRAGPVQPLALSCHTDAFFAPTAFTGQQLSTVGAPSRTTGVTMKIFDWKRRQNPDGVGEKKQDKHSSTGAAASTNMIGARGVNILKRNQAFAPQRDPRVPPDYLSASE